MRIIAINHIQNKSFCLCNICVCTVYIYYVYINAHTLGLCDLIEIVIKSQFVRVQFLNRFIARFFLCPRPPAVCYPFQSECSVPKWSVRTEQTGHTDVTPGSHILRLWCVCFFRAHVNGSVCSHCMRLRFGSVFQERCVCSSLAAIVSARSLFLLCCMRWIRVTAHCSR